MNRDLLLFGVGAGLVLAAAAAYAAAKGASGLGRALNPLNPENVFSQGANAATQALTGDPSLGGWLAETFSAEVRAANAAMRAPVVLDRWVYGDVGLGADIAYGSSGPVFAETPGGAVTGIFR